jgi:hypothetical protein
VLATLEESVREIEALLEEEYDWLTIQRDIDQLKAALASFMTRNDVAKQITDEGHWSLIRRTRGRWDESKLKERLGKSMWLKITKQVLDTEKLDDMVRKGGIKKEEVKGAYIETPEKPHLRFYAKGTSNEDEAVALKEAMGS